MRFSNEMKQVDWKLETQKSFNVIQCVYNEKMKVLVEIWKKLREESL